MSENKDLERVELRFLKFILHLPLSATNMAVRGELGQLPSDLWWKERILKYWNKICTQDVPQLLKAAMHLSLYNAVAGRNCWARNVATLFNNVSESFSEANGCDKHLRNAIMCSYRDQFIQSWHSNLMREHSLGGNGGNRLFKRNFHLEPYLVNIRHTSLRVALTRLRVCCHRLAIEVGRYHKPKPIPTSERLCLVCKCTEDDVHFLCVCPRYQELRYKLACIAYMQLQS